MIATIIKAAIGSVHHQPKSAFKSSPQSRMADKYVQKSVWRESARMATLESAAATCLLDRASNGITITETAASAMPGILRSGTSRRIKMDADSHGSEMVDPCESVQIGILWSEQVKLYWRMGISDESCRSISIAREHST
jgi:hypothetical protein